MIFPAGIKLVIWDFDGVLAKGVPSRFPASILEGFLSKDLLYHKDGSPIQFKGTNWISELAQLGIDTTNTDVLSAISKRMYDYAKDGISLFEWVHEVLPALAKFKKMAILTNNSFITAYKCLEGLEHHFSCIKGWENVPSLKPDPEGLLSICRELGILPYETLMVGDSSEDCVAAARAGAHSLIVNSGEFLGYLYT